MERVRDRGEYHPFPGWNINRCFCGVDENSIWPCKGDRQRGRGVCVEKNTVEKEGDKKKWRQIKDTVRDHFSNVSNGTALNCTKK